MSNAIQAPKFAAPLEVTKHLQSLGVDEHAIHWMLKALHPPGLEKGVSIPDEGYVESVTPDYRTTHVFTKPGALAAGNWDLILIKTPGDVIGLLAAAGAAGCDFADPAGPVTVPTILPIQNTQYITPGVMMTQDLGAADALTSVLPQAYSTMGPVSSPLMWRKTASSLTAYLTASAVADQGTVYAAQFARDYTNTSHDFGALQDPGAAGSNIFFQRKVTTLPLDESNMLLLDPKVYTNNARAGCYIPIRLSGPTQPFNKREYAVGATFSSGAAGLVLPATRIYTPYGITCPAAAPQAPTPQLLQTLPIPVRVDIVSASVNGIPARSGQLPHPENTVMGTGPCLDSGLDRMNTCVVIFRGLDSSASVTVKIIDVIEMVPNVDSPFKQFVEAPPKFAPNARSLYHKIIESTADVYPAEYNSWGKIWGDIKSAARELWPMAKPLVAKGFQEATKALSQGGSAAGSMPMMGLVSYKAPPGLLVKPQTRGGRGGKKAKGRGRGGK